MNPLTAMNSPKLTRLDAVASVTTGLTAGFAGWKIAVYLGAAGPFGISWAWLLLAVPLAWLAGVWLGYALSGRWPFFAQFGKFAAIGFTNAAVDFGIFNFIFWLADKRPDFFIVSNAVSFCLAAFHSYLWNKYWSFGARASGGGIWEFAKFISILLIALGVNTVIAYVAFASGVSLGGDSVTWANLGKIAGSAVALLVTFIGFRMVVFKPAQS